jgi:hypothetical protein
MSIEEIVGVIVNDLKTVFFLGFYKGLIYYLESSVSLLMKEKGLFIKHR